MKRWQARTRSDSIPHRGCVLLRYYGRYSATLLLSLAVLLSLALHVPGQQPAVRPGSIEIKNPLTQPLKYRFPGKEPQAETDLEFKGNNRDWSLIMFDRLPENVALKVKGKPDGYTDSEPLQPERYYPFKTMLPVVLEIKPETKMPVEIAFWYGSPAFASAKEYLKDSDLKVEDVRKFAASNQIKRDTDRQVIRFSWDAPATVSASPMPPSFAPTPEPTWWTYLTEEEPVFGIFALLLVLCVLIVPGLVVLPNLLWRIQHGSWQSPELRRKRAPTTANPTDDADLYDLFGSDTAKPTVRERTTPAQAADKATLRSWEPLSSRDDAPSLLSKKSDKEELKREPQAKARVEPTIKTPAKPEPSAAKPAATQPAALGSLDGKKLVELETKLGQLENMLGQKVDRRDNLTDAARANVDDMLVQWENSILRRVEESLNRRINEAVKPVEDLMTEQELFVQRKLEETVAQIKQATGEGEKVGEYLNFLRMLGEAQNGEIKKATADKLDMLRAEISKVRDEMNELSDLSGQMEVPDSFYARTLGVILGQNVEALQDGNFEQLSRQLGERLNQFFQMDVPHGDMLQGLRLRVDAVDAALKEVAAQMSRLNQQAADEAIPHLRRAAAFAAELGGLQEQLQNRRATIETTLRIPVSMHAGARQTFLDELGRGIRREFDKLSDPLSYFEGELKRLITTDIIAVVDICDKKIAHPGAQPALEAALNQLFKQAGLLPIMPRQGEPFKAVEQDMLQIIQSGSGKSLSIAQVVTRGFYCEQQDGKTLLRKAGVAVFR